ncbi:MAG TPA: helix-turn-helix domain-containing protein [Candidatus Ratteibacteria bacterium]|nr:helix-turn-helix domain-containing protein [Candidatus Ratteibacteria bacterium]
MKEKIEILENAIYTANEVRQILGISGEKIRNFLKSGQLKSVRIGKAYKILGKDILQLLENLKLEAEKQKEK